MLRFVKQNPTSMRKMRVVRKHSPCAYKNRRRILRNMHKAKKRRRCIAIYSHIHRRLFIVLCTHSRRRWWCRLVYLVSMIAYKADKRQREKPEHYTEHYSRPYFLRQQGTHKAKRDLYVSKVYPHTARRLFSADRPENHGFARAL